MKIRTHRILAIILSLILLIGSFPAVLSAEGDPVLWVSDVPQEGVDSERPASAIRWWYDDTDETYYLFLPTAFDAKALQIRLENAETCTIDGTAVENGAQTALLTVGAHTVSVNGADYPVVVMQSANIASMHITTESGNMDYIHAVKGNKEPGYMKMIDADGDVVYDNTLSEIKGRGNATWGRPKKPYQIKLDKKTDLLGNAGKNKTWILLANYLERSLIRNAVAYDLAYQAGLTESGLSTYVDLYCNGEYRGTYQLTEKVHINDDRVEINNLEDTTQEVNDQDLDAYPTFGPADASTPGSRKGHDIPNNPEDITGGYLLELDHPDRYAAEASGFVTTRGKPVVIKEPEYASKAQVDYIANYFQEYEDAIFSEDGKNPTTGKYYFEYFDLSSLARKYIIEELTKNIDTDATSQYFYKPSDSESTVGYCGPVWDYDNSMGNYNGTTGPEKMRAKNCFYFKELYRHESFLNAVYAEWEANFKPLLECCVNGESAPEGNVLRTFDEYYEMLAPSAAMNFTYWENINSVDTANYTDTGDTYEEHVEYLRNFLKVRTAYLSTQWSLDKIAISEPVIPEAPELNVDLPSIAEFNGSGSYAIATAEELQTLLNLSKTQSLKNSRFYLTANIDASEIDASGGQFDGFLSGLYCTVSNLRVPLFEAVAAGATVEKLTVAGATCGNGLILTNFGTVADVALQDAVLRGKRVGGIADYNLGTIERCSVSGYVLGATAAGITAVNSGTVKNCVNTAWIASTAYAAGITARNEGTVDGCTNGGAIRGATRYAIANQGDTASQTLDRSMGEGAATAKTNVELAESKALTIEQKSLLFGDANSDDALDSADAVALLQALNNGTTLAETADCTFDGKTSLADVLHILKTLGD